VRVLLNFLLAKKFVITVTNGLLLHRLKSIVCLAPDHKNLQDGVQAVLHIDFLQFLLEEIKFSVQSNRRVRERLGGLFRWNVHFAISGLQSPVKENVHEKLKN
jgi:hypothetical protein